MHPSATVRPIGIEPMGLGELGAFVGLPSKRSAKHLPESAEDVLKSVSAVTDEILLRAIDKRTGAEFMATRDADFLNYVKTLRALNDLMRIVVSVRSIDRLVGEAFLELEADLREQGSVRFGSATKDQAIFTLWTLRKMSKLISKIASSEAPPESLKAEDRRLASEFSAAVAWAQFHLDCLFAAMRFDKVIHPEVRSEIGAGLRAVVHAYGLIRQGVDLRIPRTAPEVAPQEWDEEDQELLNESMSDLETEVV